MVTMDFRKRQTIAASPAEPGDLPHGLEAHDRKRNFLHEGGPLSDGGTCNMLAIVATGRQVFLARKQPPMSGSP